MIQTKVARVVSPTELIFAAGSDDGVEEGMEFIVYSLSDPVTDPDTGEELGRIEIVKARLVAAHVHNHMTIARTKSKNLKHMVDSAMNSLFANAFQRIEVLDDEMAIEKSEAFRTPDLVVRVGDLARTVSTSVKSRMGELALA